MRSVDVLTLVASILICQVAGLIGSLFTTPAIPTWYAGLAKPWFTPPRWLFAPVWTSLFLLMGIALFIVWRQGWGDRAVRIALSAFGAQLVLNILWSVLFFGLRSPLAGLIEIVVLWFAIALTVASCWRVSTRAGVLLVPYLVWVGFAMILNLSIWRLNVGG
jgi:benzodiazapine receptor